jgi:trimeric autotransporter adhesin
VVTPGAGAGQFSVLVQPGSPIAANGSLSFDIRFSPTAIGLQSAQISIANDDSDENPSVFTIQGAGAGSLADLILRSGFE